MLNSRKTVMLTITESCNLNCVYCYEHNKTSNEMPKELVFSIIEDTLQKCNTAVEFSFHGGEPFIKFDLMREVAEYFWNKYNPDNKYVFFSSTNGTILNDDIKTWLFNNKKNFWCGISYDGTNDMQDKNRSSSSKNIDLDFFIKTWPKQPVKMTISQETLSNLAEGTIYLHEKGFNINNNLAYGLDWNNEKFIKILSDQLEILIEYYLNNPEISPSSIISMNVEWFTKDINIKAQRFCGAGRYMKCFDTKGKEYPCHFFMDINSSEQKSKVSNIDILNSDDCLLDSFCNDCEIRLVCPTCYGYNFVSTGNPVERDKNLCILSKIQAVACAILSLRKIQKYGKLIFRNEEIPIGNALNGINCVLNNEFFINDERLKKYFLI